MRNIFLFPLLVIISSFGFAQDTLKQPLNFVQVMPTYPGGDKALFEFLSNNINYPEPEKSLNIEGTVFVNFFVEKDGTPSLFTITRGVEGGKGLDREALAACKKLGKFIPGSQNGVPVRISLTIPIKFHIGTEKSQFRKIELRRIKRDGKEICRLLYEITEAEKVGDKNKSYKLKADFVLKVKKIEKEYPELSLKKLELSGIIRPCMEEADKLDLEK